MNRVLSDIPCSSAASSPRFLFILGNFALLVSMDKNITVSCNVRDNFFTKISSKKFFNRILPNSHWFFVTFNISVYSYDSKRRNTLKSFKICR